MRAKIIDGVFTPAPRKIRREIDGEQYITYNPTDEMLAVIKDEGLLEKTMEIVAEKIDFYVNNRTRSDMKISVVVFSTVYGVLCTTGAAEKWMAELKEKYSK